MARATTIRTFINDLKNDGDFTTFYARLPSNDDMIRKNRATQIRSKKHDADAFGFDVLGNLTVLYADGSIRQYIGREEIKAAGVSR